MTSDDPSTADMPIGWVRAVLELAIMAVLAEGERHGYALAQRIAQLGVGPVRGGSLYPVLGRMEAEDLVRSVWQAGEGGPGRKVYMLTEVGRRRLTASRDGWGEFTAAVDRLLTATIGER